MAINLKDFGGDMNVKQTAKDGEMDSETFDVKGEGFGGDANVDQSFEGIKTRKSWVWAVIAIVGGLVAIAGYYFNARLTGETSDIKTEIPFVPIGDEMPETVIDDLDEALMENDTL